MAIDENFLMTEILKLNTAVAGISGKIDGFLQSQLGMQTEISGIKSRLDSTEDDIADIKTIHLTIRNRILGASAICSAGAAALLTFGWPIIQKKFGL